MSGRTRWRLGVRLALFSAALAAVVIGVVFAALSVQVREASTRQVTEQLTRQGQTLTSLQRESQRHLVQAAALLGESPTLRSALSTYRVERQGGADRPDLANTVDEALARLGADLQGNVLLVTDEHGQVFAGRARPAGREEVSVRGVDLSSLPAVRNALDPALVTSADTPYLSALEVGSGIFAVGAAPVILDGYTIGTVVFGQRIDSAAVAALARDFDAQVVVAAGSQLVGGTLPAREAQVVLAANVQPGQAIHLHDGDFLAAVVPVGNTQRGSAVRIMLLQPLSATVKRLTDALFRDFLLFGALGVGLAALGSLLLSRSLLRPLGRFIEFMRRGAAHERADSDFPLGDASREIVDLKTSFDQLMASLHDKRAELEQRGAALAASNEILLEEVARREQTEEVLRESEAQLRQAQKLEAVGMLAGGIAHDFNNMLTVITGFTELALARLGRSHEVARDLQQVVEASSSAASLTHQLLAFSRKQVLQPRVLDLNDVVTGMSEMMRRLLGARHALVITPYEGVARIKADPGQLEQVLLNLVVNARDAMSDDGTFSVTITRRQAEDGRDVVVLRAGDTGVGMPAHVRDRIFEPFFTTKDPGKGTGLGLSTVYGIVTQSGGRLAVESAPGEGTTFSLEFPAVAEPVTLTATGSDEGEPPRGNERVLVVDDDARVRDLARRALEDAGYDVRTASNGLDALLEERDEPPADLVITDIVMPRLTGPQFVKRYVARHPAVAVIYMTGHVDDEVLHVELQEDVILLRKPFSPADLARIARRALDLRGVDVTHA